MQQITILGFGISAESTIDFLLARGLAEKIKVSELKQRSCFDEVKIAGYEARGVEFEFGQQSSEFISGSDFVMISPGILPGAPIISTITDYGSDLDLLLNYSDAMTVAVTGTNGKTTTTSLIAHILGNEALGNVGKPFLEFNPDDKVLALEVSSFQLYYSKLDSMPDVAVYLNMTDDHLDWHSSLREYQEAKAKLFQGPGTKVMNYDDLIVRDLAVNKENVRFFSTETVLDAGAWLESGKLYLDGQELINVEDLKLVGKHNYSNVLAAVLACQAVAIDLDQIQERLTSFKAVPHRLEYIATVDGHPVYNDSKATNPDSAIKALEAFDQSIAIVGGKNKNLDLSQFIKVLTKKCAAVVAIGELQDSIVDQLSSHGFSDVSKASSLDEALRVALDYAKSLPEIPIVLAPASSSFDMFAGYQERGEKFREVVMGLVVLS